MQEDCDHVFRLCSQFYLLMVIRSVLVCRRHIKVRYVRCFCFIVLEFIEKIDDEHVINLSCY